MILLGLVALITLCGKDVCVDVKTDCHGLYGNATGQISPEQSVESEITSIIHISVLQTSVLTGALPVIL